MIELEYLFVTGIILFLLWVVHHAMHEPTRTEKWRRTSGTRMAHRLTKHE